MYKRKLLILHPYLAPYRIDLYNHLSIDYDVTALLYASDKEISSLGYDLNRIENLARFGYIKKSHGLYIGRHLISSIYYKILNQFRPDIVLSHELGINTLVVILLKKVFGYKLYTTFDDSPAMAMTYSRKRNILRKYVLNHIDGAILVNPQVCNYLRGKYPKCNFLYFPIIQDDKTLMKNILSSEKKADEYINEYNIKDKKIVLFVGRQIAIKSPDVLVRIFADINDESAVLVLVGSGTLENDIREFIIDNNLQHRIIQTGALSGESLYAWYYLAHIFVLPSRFEPFGAVVNEALVAGCRVLVSDKVGAASLINQINGNIFKIDSPNTLHQMLADELQYVSYSKNIESHMLRSFDEYYKEFKSFLQ